MKNFVIALSLILLGSIVSPLTLAGEGKAQVVTAQLLEDFQSATKQQAEPKEDSRSNQVDLFANTNPEPIPENQAPMKPTKSKRE